MSAITWSPVDRDTWCAARGSARLTVTRLVSNRMYRADIDGPGVAERSPEFSARSAAQRSAEAQTGGAA